MKKTLIAMALVFSPACIAANPAPMTLPNNGECEEFYHFIEGVCVHATAMSDDPNNMRTRIQEFKKSGKATPPKANTAVKVKNEDPLCTKYKERLKKYLNEGVMGINPATGKLQKMTGKQADDVIKDTKDNIEILCN